jgi:hypothetical protein
VRVSLQVKMDSLRRPRALESWNSGASAIIDSAEWKRLSRKIAVTSARLVTE